MKLRKRKKNKNTKIHVSFFVTENIVYLIVIILIIVLRIGLHHAKLDEPNSNIIEIITTVLSSVLIPVALNIGKYFREKRIFHTNCESIVQNSIVLVNRLNGYLIVRNNPPVSQYSDLKNAKYLQEINFSDFDVLDELFDLIAKKLTKIVNLDYLQTNDVFECVANNTILSITAAYTPKDYAQLYIDLGQVVGLLEVIKVPHSKDSYSKIFNEEIGKVSKKLISNSSICSSEYLISYLEEAFGEK